MLVGPSRMTHQLRALVAAPAQTYVSLVALTEGSPRTAPCAPPARRLHGRAHPSASKETAEYWDSRMDEDLHNERSQEL